MASAFLLPPLLYRTRVCTFHVVEMTPKSTDHSHRGFIFKFGDLLGDDGGFVDWRLL